MHGLDIVNTTIFVGSALVLLGIFSSLVATRFGAPLLLVFLVVGMLAGQDGPGGIVFNNYSTTYLVGSVVARGHPVRRRPAHPPLGLPRRARPVAAAGDRRSRHHRGGRRRRRLGGARPAAGGSLSARLDHRLDRRRRRLLPAPHRRAPAAAPRGGHPRDRVRHQRPDRGLPRPDPHPVHPRRRPHQRVGARARDRPPDGLRHRLRVRRRAPAGRHPQPRHHARRAASALRRGGRDPDLRRRLPRRRQRAPRGLRRGPRDGEPAGRAPIPRSSASTTPSPGSARS